VRCRETLKLEPTKANLQYAERLRGEILNAIIIFDNSARFLSIKFSFNTLTIRWSSFLALPQ